MKNLFSLKYKLFFLLITIPTFVLGSYLYFSISEYKKDKLAYVHDANVSLARSFSSQLFFEVDQLAQKINRFNLKLGQRPTKNKWKKTAKEFQFDDSIIFSVSKNASVKIKFFDSSKYQLKEKWALSSFFTANLSSLINNKIAFSVDEQKRNWFFIKLRSDMVFAMPWKSEKLESIYNKKSDVKKLFLNHNLTPIMQGKNNSAVDTERWKKFMLHTSGSFEVKDFTGVEYIVSYSKIEQFGVTLINYVPNEVAFRAVSKLAERSIYIFGALNCFAIIVSLLLVNRYTSQIKKIIAATKEFAKGDLKVKVPIVTSDETGALAQTFNRMTDDINTLVTERNSVIHELQDTQKQLVQTEKLAIIGEMSAAFSHEISNPVTIVKVSYDFIMRNAKDDIPEKTLKNLNHMKQGIDRLHEICLRLKKFVHQRSDESEEKVETNMNELVQNSIEFLNPIIKKSNVEVLINLESDLKSIINRGMIQQIIVNLIKNAIEAMTDAETKDAQIKILGTLDKESQKIKIKFIDNGPGIERSHQEKLFSPFFTTKDSGEGTGLGLSVSKKIANDHGGDLEVDSDVNKGTTFILSLPDLTNSYCPMPSNSMQEKLDLGEGEPILVVDDEHVIRAYIAEVVESFGYEAIQAANGEEGLELFKKHKPKLVLTDFFMPVMDGVRMALEIRRLKSETIIIGITGSRSVYKESEVTHLDQILDKPFEIDNFERILEELTQYKKSA